MNLAHHTKILGPVLVAVLAVSAFAATSAQASAPHWTVGGKTIIATESQAFTAKSTGTIGLEVAGLSLRSTTSKDCTASGSIVGSGGGAPGTSRNVTIKCTNVEVLVGGNPSSGCTVHSPGQANGTVITNELRSTLVWLEETGTEKVGNTFTPESGTTFVTLEVTGNECPEFLFERYDITGNVIATVDPVKKDVEEGTLTLPETPHKTYWTNQTPTRVKDVDSGLLWKGGAAVFWGTFDFGLVSKELFGVEPG
jgi:hypothetical protein